VIWRWSLLLVYVFGYKKSTAAHKGIVLLFGFHFKKKTTQLIKGKWFIHTMGFGVCLYGITIIEHLFDNVTN
jgi:hypothetical protein